MRKFANPIIPSSPMHNAYDPYVLLHNGYYYHCYDGVDGVYVSKAERLQDIGNVEPCLVYAYQQSGALHSWYAPELYFLDGVWYIYGSPDIGNGVHSMSVLMNTDPEPITPFTNMGHIQNLGGGWSLDGTVFMHEGKNYFIWSSGRKLHISLLNKPWELADEGRVIGELEYEFEKRSGLIMEGPAVLQKDGRVYLVYSCNDSMTDDYALGIMTLTGNDPTSKASWTKHPYPIFEKTEDIFGPGHCSFTKVWDDGEWKDYVVYHANLTSCTGWCGRSAWAQEVFYDKDGFPVLGTPQF